MATYVFDLEGDSLSPTLIWCIGVQDVEKDYVHTTVDYEAMRRLFSNPAHTFICHNGKRFDKPVIERILDIKMEARLIDTLFTSWYLEPKRPKHGLDSYGNEAGIPKPVVTDWSDQPIEVYLHRVEEDVKINMYVWKKHLRMLLKLYGDMEKVDRLLDYLMLHADVAANQEKFGWRLDIPRAERVYAKLLKDEIHSHTELAKVMPNVPIYAKRKKPKDCYKMDGELSAYGIKWFALLKEKDLPKTHTGEIKVVTGHKPCNAGSVTQQKDWLFSMGWKPVTFKFDRNKKTGEVKKIPQLRIKTDKGPRLSPCVARLLEKEPKLELIAKLGVITHRKSVLNGFLKTVDENGFISAQMQGLTNTLRWKHKVVLNLPGVDKLYGEDMRGCLIAPEGYELAGSDMCALEDRTKQHFMWPHDPDYVKAMMADGYCPHVDIAVLAGFLTKEQEDRHKSGKFIDADDKKNIKAGRKNAKPVNYGGLYGQQALGLSQSADMPIAKATKLINIYWERNWAVKAVADEQITKKCNGLTWLYNPVSELWYELRNTRDIFSTLNQGTGAYCFTLWIKNIMDLGGPPIIGNMHDEVICLIRKVAGARAKCEKLLHKAIMMVNEDLKLNRDLAVDVQFDDSYAGIH
jgi:hypothetical protein